MFLGYVLNEDDGLYYSKSDPSAPGINKQELLELFAKEKKEHNLERASAGILRYSWEQVRKMTARGGKYWHKGNYYRVYFDPKALGFQAITELKYSPWHGRKVPNIVGGTWQGRELDKTTARKIAHSDKNYIDLVTAEVKSDCDTIYWYLYDLAHQYD